MSVELAIVPNYERGESVSLRTWLKNTYAGDAPEIDEATLVRLSYIFCDMIDGDSAPDALIKIVDAIDAMPKEAKDTIYDYLSTGKITDSYLHTSEVLMAMVEQLSSVRYGMATIAILAFKTEKTNASQVPTGKTSWLSEYKNKVSLYTFSPLDESTAYTVQDAAEGDWQERALCSETDPEAFFPEKGGSTREAKKVCTGCEVKVECLNHALENQERFGIWGGLSERERRRLHRRTK